MHRIRPGSQDSRRGLQLGPKIEHENILEVLWIQIHEGKNYPQK